MFTKRSRVAFPSFSAYVRYMFFLDRRPTRMEAICARIVRAQRSPSWRFISVVPFKSGYCLTVRDTGGTVQECRLADRRVTASVTWFFVFYCISNGSVNRRYARPRLAVDEFRCFEAHCNGHADRVCTPYVRRSSGRSRNLQIGDPCYFAFCCEDGVISLRACVSNKV